MTRPPPRSSSGRPLAARPKKRFGQHFLAAPDKVDRIVRSAEVGPGDRVLEIGPGRGVLTEALLATGAKVTAIELDRDLAEGLRAKFPTLELHSGDAMRLDLSEVCPGAGWKVVANLPYNVGTAIVLRLLEEPTRFPTMVLMFQKEVADRLAATEADDAYGSLSVHVGLRATVTNLFLVPPGSFVPPPKVDSAVVRLDAWPTPKLEGVPERVVDRLVRLAFAHRRKTLRNNLSAGWSREEVERACAEVGVDPGCRAETLAPGVFVRLAGVLAAGAAEGGAAGETEQDVEKVATGQEDG